MHYFEVLVSSNRYHGNTTLTYEYNDMIPIGSVVVVQMQNKSILAMVRNLVQKPTFKTKTIERVIPTAPLPIELFHLIDWLKDYYPAPLGTILQLFLPSSLLQQNRAKSPVIAGGHEYVTLPLLTDEQQDTIKTLSHISQRSVLLHGNTGSGKTRIYIELAKQSIQNGRSVLVLTPEIGLTPQLVDAFSQVFPDKIFTVHSTLTPSNRRNIWLRINDSREPIVVIGPRSALFSPLHKLGLIIIDESHESAYKQEQAPYYQASRVAAKLAELHQAQLILGSATPPINDYYTFIEKKLPIIRMVQFAKNQHVISPRIQIIDIRDRSYYKRSGWLSTNLIEAINQRLINHEQSLIFLNRRGTARLVICQKCGWQALCVRCDLPLTYHGDIHRLQCHTCGYSETAPSACPVCQSLEIVFRSIGTKSLFDELHHIFPKAHIKRFDSDSTKQDSLEAQYQSILDGTVDILVGTQILGKGLDLPKLSLVGVVVADTSLYFPDYTAEERTFQMLTQVIGRVGRGHRAGEIIVQSYHPNSETIKFALEKNYEKFYEQQLKERAGYHFPPYYYVLKLRCNRASQTAAQRTSEQLVLNLKQKNLPIEISGPSPAFIGKVNNKYIWQIIVKAKHRTILTDIINALPTNWSYDIDPTNLL